MNEKIETQGKTVEEAVNEALLRLGARRDEVDVTVLDEPKSGFLGILGGRQAKVEVTRKRSRRRGQRNEQAKGQAHDFGDGGSRSNRGSRGGRRGSSRRNSGDSRDKAPAARTEGRKDERSEGRKDQRQDNRNEGRRDNRGGGRNESRSGGRNEARSGGRNQGDSAGRQQAGNENRDRNRRPRNQRGGRGDNRPENNAAARTEEPVVNNEPRQERSERRPRNQRRERPASRDRQVQDRPVQAEGNERQERTERPARQESRPRRERPGRNDRNDRNDRNSRGNRRDRDNRNTQPDRREHPAAAQVDRSVVDEIIATGISVGKYAQPVREVAEEQLNPTLGDMTTGLLARAGFPARCEVGDGEYRQVKVITSDESAGMLIGRHGNTIDSVEHLVERMISMAAGDRVKMNLDINNYRLRRHETLLQRVEEAVAHVRETGKTYHVEPMNARERRIVHLAAEDHSGIRTFTMDSHRGRHVIIALDNEEKSSDSEEKNLTAVADEPATEQVDATEMSTVEVEAVEEETVDAPATEVPESGAPETLEAVAVDSSVEIEEAPESVEEVDEEEDDRPRD